VIFSRVKTLMRAATCLLLVSLTAQHAAASDGLLDLSVDAATGSVYLHLEQLPAEYLYVPALQSGAGSNDLGLDRGKLDRTRRVRFERYGHRVLLLEPNLAFRAETENAAERRAVTEAFAQSALAGFEIEKNGEGDRLTIDLSAFLLSDVTRISALVADLEQGEFEPDPDRSAIDTAGIRNFPENTLIPVLMTFKGTGAGDFIRDVTPTPDSLTVRVTHQFVRIPDGGYQVREFHPRSGYFDLPYRNYAAPLTESIEKRLINRHRLEPGETLRYYVDNGTPEPVRSALIEGASWWNEAFEAAGFTAGFRVDVLPEDVDPLDARFNVIQWVHRSTRGWSYGSSIADPLTGEIIKGHVSLGSLRVRQDQLIAEALTVPFTQPDEQSAAATEMALARLRQLSAHEVGHTLGIDHNFAASYSGDASVMDYPHPNLYLDGQGRVRLDRAYASGISPWDKLVVRYGYSQFEQGQEKDGLRAILAEADQQGITFVTDRDARLPGSANPEAHLWDNGSDVLDRMQEILVIRETGLANFSTAVLRNGTPLFEMERRLVPVYLLHRYQLEAVAKLLGGLHYGYDLKDGRASRLEPVAADVQQRALNTMVSLLQPRRLALPVNLHYLVPPAANGYSRDREFFDGRTGQAFDHLAPVRAGADLVISELLQPQRLARLAEQQALNPGLPGISTVFDALIDVSWGGKTSGDGYLRQIRSETDWRILRGLMTLYADDSAADIVREQALSALISAADGLRSGERRGEAHATAMRREIIRFLERQPAEQPDAPNTVPPGSPIG